jgi:hypothetical protein
MCLATRDLAKEKSRMRRKLQKTKQNQKVTRPRLTASSTAKAPGVLLAFEDCW